MTPLYLLFDCCIEIREHNQFDFSSYFICSLSLDDCFSLIDTCICSKYSVQYSDGTKTYCAHSYIIAADFDLIKDANKLVVKSIYFSILLSNSLFSPSIKLDF